MTEVATSGYVQVIPLTLVEETHPLLSTVLEEYDFAAEGMANRAQGIAGSLAEQMLKYKGLGLSSNQLGMPYRAFAMATNPILICFNPRLIDVSSDLALLEEGCLSYPGLHVKIKRPAHIKVRFTNQHGEIFTEKFSGLTARIFQHELDHMNGVNFLTRAGPLALESAKNKWRKLKKINAAKRKMGFYN